MTRRTLTRLRPCCLVPFGRGCEEDHRSQSALRGAHNTENPQKRLTATTSHCRPRDAIPAGVTVWY